MESGSRRTSGHDVTNHVSEKSRPKSGKKCFNCDKEGHIARDCRKPKKKRESGADNGTTKGVTFALAIGDEQGNYYDGTWILDSGSSRHLVNDATILQDVEDCASDCVLPDGATMNVTLKGTAVIEVETNGIVNTVKITDVHYAPKLARNILSYGLLESKGCILRTTKGLDQSCARAMQL
jgi:hypothetical protein